MFTALYKFLFNFVSCHWQLQDLAMFNSVSNTSMATMRTSEVVKLLCEKSRKRDIRTKSTKNGFKKYNYVYIYILVTS